MLHPHSQRSSDQNTSLPQTINEHAQSIQPETEQTNPADERQEHPFIEILRFSIIALIIVIPIRMFIAQPFIVSGASMEDTFRNNEYLIVDQISYHINSPNRGDVVIFRYPQDPSKFFIKRVIGVPGDTVTVEGDQVIISNESLPGGVLLDEPYVSRMSPNSFSTEVLGEREYYVMGDNRDESSDSRVWGVLQEEHIIGRAFLRLFPPRYLDYLPGAHALDNVSISTQ